MSMDPATPLVVIMTMSQPDLDYITANPNSTVGSTGSFTNSPSCPDDPAHHRNSALMHCCIQASGTATPYIQIMAAQPSDGCPYKIVIGNCTFGINVQ